MFGRRNSCITASRSVYSVRLIHTSKHKFVCYAYTYMRLAYMRCYIGDYHRNKCTQFNFAFLKDKPYFASIPTLRNNHFYNIFMFVVSVCIILSALLFLSLKVNIIATEDCLIFSWSQDRLRKQLCNDLAFQHVFEQLIGKDISQKLYEIQERMVTGSSLDSSARRSSMVNVRSSIVSSSTTNLVKLNCLQGLCSFIQLLRKKIRVLVDTIL